MISRLGLILGAALLLAGTASAATFTANGGAGSSTVGSGGDYATLYDAALDFSTSPQAVTGNYTFFITGNLTETVSAAFGKATNGFTVTIKPAAATTPVVTYTQNTDNAGTTGNIIIGAAGLANMDADIVKTDGFVIDGSNTVGGTTRDLTLTCSGQTFASRMVRLVGNSDNVVVKNAIVTNATTGNGFAIDATSRLSGGIALVPDNFTVQNCAVTSVGGVSAQALQTGNSGTIPAGTAQTGLVLRDNVFTGRTRGVFLNQTADALIEGNTLRVNQTTTGYNSMVLMHNTSNATNGWTMTIRNNVIDLAYSGNTGAGASVGMTAMELTGAPAAPNVGNYDVYNNMIAGFGFPTGAATDMVYRGIRSGSASVNLRIYHNSIFMPDIDRVSGATADRVFAIGVTSTGATASADIRNNNIRIGETGYGISKGNATGLVSNYNNISFATSIGRLAGVDYASLAAWQGASSQDANSGTIDPTSATSPGVWTSATNLRFTDFPGGLKQGILLALVPTDIDGNARDAARPFPGAHEQQIGGVPVNLSGFSID